MFVPVSTTPARPKYLWMAVLAGVFALSPYWSKGDTDEGKTSGLDVDLEGYPLPPRAVVRMGTARLTHSAHVACVAFSPDGRILASGSGDQTIRFWDVENGKEMKRIASPDTATSSIAFSPDGKMLASADVDMTVRLWDIESGKEVLRLTGHTASVAWVAYSSDGKTLASRSWDGVRVWEIASGKELAKFDAPGSQLAAVGFHVDAKTLASASHGRQTVLWHFAADKLPMESLEQMNKGYSMDISLDAKTLAWTGQDMAIHLWDVATGKELPRLEHTHPVGRMAFSPDGKMLASASYDEPIHLWDVATGRRLAQLNGPVGAVYFLAFSPDGQTLALGCERKILLWNVQTGKRTPKPSAHDKRIECLVLTPDGKKLVSGSEDNSARLWDVTTGRQLLELHGHNDAIRSVALSLENDMIASGGADKTIRIWRLGTGDELMKFQLMQQEENSCLSFSHDQKILACGTDLGTIYLWDTASGNELWKLKGHEKEVVSLQFLLDGESLISTGRDNTTRVWNLEVGREMLVVKASAPPFHRTAISPDGQLLAGGRTDEKSVWLGELLTGRELFRLLGHRGGIWSVAFSSDGKLLASGSFDKTIRLWETVTGKEILKLEGHDGPVSALVFSNDGRMLVSGSWDANVLVWNLALQGLGPGIVDLGETELQQIWDDLGAEDGAVAYRAIWILSSAPEKTLRMLRNQAKRKSRDQSVQERIHKLISELDHSDWSVREKATLELQQIGAEAGRDLRKVLRTSVSERARLRARLILEAMETRAVRSPTTLRWLRATQVLERIHTPEAQELLRRIAKNAVSSIVREDAKAALARIEPAQGIK